jgi:hypothetical protein
MMAEKKIISIRFHKDSKADMELYKMLEEEAGSSSSLAAVAKARIRDSYQSAAEGCGSNGFQEQILTAVREEMQQSGIKIAGALISCMNGTGGALQYSPEDGENRLPEESGELPNGALDFLDG